MGQRRNRFQHRNWIRPTFCLMLVAQILECWCASTRVMGLIPSRGCGLLHQVWLTWAALLLTSCYIYCLSSTTLKSSVYLIPRPRIEPMTFVSVLWSRVATYMAASGGNAGIGWIRPTFCLMLVAQMLEFWTLVCQHEGSEFESRPGFWSVNCWLTWPALLLTY